MVPEPTASGAAPVGRTSRLVVFQPFENDALQNLRGAAERNK